MDGRDETFFAKSGFFISMDPTTRAGARQALLEKFANEFLSRIGGDNFVDGFLHGSRIPLG
jgi:hypothetical protein